MKEIISKEVGKVKEKKRGLVDKLFFLYILAYGFFSSAFLTQFPFVHSDESWLAGLSRDMLTEKSLSVTEHFFDARPRYPHAIKSLFHLLQMGFIRIFGYSIESVRLLSLAAGIVFLIIFYFLIKRITKREKLALAVTVLFSLDVEFIYASHFARQEILLGVAFIAGLFLLLGQREPGVMKVVLTAVITGISIGIHPNSFLLACSFGAILFYLFLQIKKDILPLVTYIGVTGAFAAVFVLISYSFDSQFLKHYFQNGAMEFDVDASLAAKVSELRGFFERLFTGQSGTYYVTELRFSLLLFAFLMVFMGIYALVMKRRLPGALISGTMGLLGGMIFIGRYNQTSVFFFFPFGYLLLALFLAEQEEKGKRFIYALILAVTVLISIEQIRPWLSKGSHAAYLEQIEELVPKDSTVIANLNTEFYFSQGCLRDYRNLPYVWREKGIEAYIKENGIEYILYSTELDYLHEHRPYFNVIYGDIRFVPELKRLCEEKGELIGEFTDTVYGSRVIGVMGQEKYSHVLVYKLKELDT
ncbi:phospholipid carrier-dependent glycosyltransferase [Acetivibrio ethanolgignens]|uniref:ArnT-like N-terminal domain-containing protein n=1 Tax=Acetivibrio ethanolgignens TaxID=290052 RepID=A0A0V8QEY0_9FIRM|nr:glycosyltransferase family 39 protein [Acetivibrio ethanolgignens]KSV59020.1 hypothetical protein ASU35_01480 [Acetivibrio ethanolgignens]